MQLQLMRIVMADGTALLSELHLLAWPTDAPVSCLKNSIKIYIKTAPTCFGVTVTPSSGSAVICAY